MERDQQFQHIHREASAFMAEGDPVLSIDGKKKEKVGLFRNAGRNWRPQGEPVQGNAYDFPRRSKGTAIPYGTYDVGRNEGYVNVGMNHETGEFAVESLRWWWRTYGRRRYPGAMGLLLCADGGGGNGSHRRAWKCHVQERATEMGLSITVCPYPPGTRKWNRHVTGSA